MADKIEDWFTEAKKLGLSAEVAKWAFRLARAKGRLAQVDRALKAHEQDVLQLSYLSATASAPPSEESANLAAGVLRQHRDDFADLLVHVFDIVVVAFRAVL